MSQAFFPSFKSKKGRTYLFSYDNFLGQGVYCQAFKVYDLSSIPPDQNLRLADVDYLLDPLVMKLSKSFLPDEKKRRIRHEVKMLKKLKHHSNFVSYVDHSLELPTPYLVTEFVPLTLDSMLHQGQLTNQVVWDYLTQISLVLEEFERRGIAHGDLKSSNIGYHPDSRKIKVFDLGLGLFYDHKCLSRLKRARNGIYYPPEFKIGLISPSSDVYMAGRTLEYLLTGCYAEGYDHINETIDNIETVHKITLPPSFRKVLNGMLDLNYEERLLPQELREMVSLAWEEMENKDYFKPIQFTEIRIPTGLSDIFSLTKSH